MAIVDVLLTQSPETWTITLDANTKHLVMWSATGAGVARFFKTMIITNISASNSCFIAFKTGAATWTEEYELKAGATLNVSFDRDNVKEIRINGTSWQKFTYMFL